MNRCKYCDSICPDFSDVCDTCAYIEEEDILEAERLECEEENKLFEEELEKEDKELEGMFEDETM